MSILHCPRCRRTNPDEAAFCYFDGAELRSRQDGSFHRLAQEFVFPSGRRCRTFDEFAEACRDEWPAARHLLLQGTFKQYFGGTGRTDLAKVAHETMGLPDADIGLTRFLDALPVSQIRTPKIDINPRRLLLGNLLAGEQRQLALVVTNEGQGTLQGTLTITEGSDWLKAVGPDAAQCAIATQREQKIALAVDTRGLPAGGAFGARLRVITNGGVVEVTARMDLVAQPFSKPPFQGAKTPREIAERMRRLPKAAVPALENGDVSRWFAGNGWNFPIRGAQAKGVAGVQQFFETMGLSKPPAVHVAPAELHLSCVYPHTLRSQVGLQTAAKKWVYATVTSDSPWLRVLTPQVGGPQQAIIGFEIDPKLGVGVALNGKLAVTANGGAVMTVKVLADVRGSPGAMRASSVPGTGAGEFRPMPARLPSGGLLRPVLALALAFLLVRLLLVPLTDLSGRSIAVAEAAAKLGVPITSDSPLTQVSGWLDLPWATLLLGTGGDLPASLFEPAQSGTISAQDFRHYFAGYFLRYLILCTGWLGALWGAVTLVRHAGMAQLPWGLIGGGVAGVGAAITVGSFFLFLEILPHALWNITFAGHGSGGTFLFFWIIFALGSWTAAGALAGLVLGLIPPLHSRLAMPVQNFVSRFCGLCGLHGLGDACRA